MKKCQLIRIAAAILVSVIVAMQLSGCSKPQPAGNEYKFEVATTTSGQVASNDIYTLEWDDDAKCILLKSRITEKVWSTIPYSFYLEGESNVHLCSPINIRVMELKTKEIDIARGYSAVEMETVSSREIENGIELTYYFEEFDISIPIQYILRDDSLAISLDPTKIVENSSFQIMSVSVAPFLCSAANNAEDSYLFVPSGNGALMYTNQTVDKERSFSSEVYGFDASRMVPERLIDEDIVKLPVFGVKEGNDALLGIIESGEEMATIQAEAGSRRTGFSDVYATFYLRGYDIFASNISWATGVLTSISKEMSNTRITIRYYPLVGEQATYSGMAQRYRKYLIDNGKLSEHTGDERQYSLTLLGSIKTRSLFFGIPYYSSKCMTSYTDAKSILEDLVEATGVAPAVQLKGYGKDGIDIGKVAGGFKLSSVHGTKKQHAQLEESGEELGVPLYTDFDVIYFNSSGSGYFTLYDAAKTATLHKTTQYHKYLVQKAYNKDLGGYFLLKRHKLDSVISKLINKASKMNISAVSLSTLGYTAYSDYTQEQYYSKGKIAEDVNRFMSKIKESGFGVATDNANAYAACSTDSIFNIPLSSKEHNGLDAHVPFYQMVFKGSKALYSSAINLSTDFQSEVLLALESGTGLGFTLLARYDVSYARTIHTNLYNSLYDDIRLTILDTVKKYKPYYEAIKGACIKSHSILSNNMTKTVFDNGVIAYVNHSNQPVESPAGQIEAYDFRYVRGGA
jgi:hypothetical protein